MRCTQWKPLSTQGEIPQGIPVQPQGNKTVDESYEWIKSVEGAEKRRKEEGTILRWISSMELCGKSLKKMILAARRWGKIENEGFNDQENGIYRIEHLNSTVMKKHYLLTQTF